MNYFLKDVNHTAKICQSLSKYIQSIGKLLTVFLWIYEWFEMLQIIQSCLNQGHDTTAAAMNWAVHLIGADPEVQKKIHEEMHQIFGESF